MKKFMLGLFTLCIGFFVLATISVGAPGEEPIFLLGQNEKAEVVLPSGQVIPLELGKNPLQVLTNKKGQKLILCGGEEKKSGEIKQGAFLGLIAQDLKTYEKIIQCDSALTAYTINNDGSTIWLATQGGISKNEIINPKIYQISLESLIITEVVLDSIPCEIALSSDSKWLAVATLGKAETSILTLFETEPLKLAATFDIVKNPGLLSFNDDNTALVVAGYGSPDIVEVVVDNNGEKEEKSFIIPTEHNMKLKTPTPAGVNIIDLISLQSKQVELGMVNQGLVAGADTTIYGFINGESNGSVIAASPVGLLWEKKCDFVPRFIQERPGTSQIFIIGGKKISIIDKQNGNPVKDITTDSDLIPFAFLNNSVYAYSYNMNKQKLSIMNLDNFEVGKSLAVGSKGLAAFKTVVMIASVAQYGNSLQPQYVNGVRIPANVSRIYWSHAPQGNMVAVLGQKKLYMLNSFLAEIYSYDINKGIVAKKLGYLGEKTLYLQMAPNGKYVILVSGDKWKLVNTVTDKADLTFDPVGLKVSFAFQSVAAPTPYFSPDGEKMYIASGSKITVIDLRNGAKLAAFDSKTKDALVCW
jgi:DNA-binding beta-propeller fold protein YncE